jgi:hypothetical protein
LVTYTRRSRYLERNIHLNKYHYEHVGFKEDWVVCPIDDCTDKVWSTDGETVKYADSQEEFNSDGLYYEDR